MTDSDFAKGWAVLLAQPYAREYVLDEKRCKVQMNLYRSKFIGTDPVAWLQSIDYWVSHKSRWPLIPDLKTLVHRYEARKVAKPEQAKLSDAPYIPLSDGDITQYAREKGITFLEAIKQWETILREKQDLEPA